MENNTQLIEKLNDLLEYLTDSYKGYEQCAKGVDDKKMANLFESFAAKRKSMQARLIEKIKSLGGTYEEGGSATGAMHRVFVNLKSLLTDGNVDSIVNEIKRGENTMITRYKEVLRENISENIHSFLRDQLKEIEDDLARVDEFSVVS